jgi:hypothetical protein
MLEQTVGKFKVPKFMNLPWLTKEYVKKNGWCPVCDEWLQDPYFVQFENTCFGRMPWKSRDEYKPGDIIIFHEFEEWEDEEGYNTDRFCVVEKEEIEQYQRGERDLLPVGVVVHPPSNQLNLFN